MRELMTMAAFARRKRVARSTVTRAVQSGRVVLTPDGRVDVLASDHAWDAMRLRMPSMPRGRDWVVSPAVAAWLDDDEVTLPSEAELDAMLADARADVEEISNSPEFRALLNGGD